MISQYRVNLCELALQSLDKKTLKELCNACGVEITNAKSRSREGMASKLTYFIDFTEILDR